MNVGLIINMVPLSTIPLHSRFNFADLFKEISEKLDENPRMAVEIDAERLGKFAYHRLAQALAQRRNRGNKYGDLFLILRKGHIWIYRKEAA